MSDKSLEEIFWNEGKFHDKEGNEVDPKPLGTPFKVVYDHEAISESEQWSFSSELYSSVFKRPGLDLPGRGIGYNGVNAFSRSEDSRAEPLHKGRSVHVQLYKIEKN